MASDTAIEAEPYRILPANWRDLRAIRRLEQAAFGPDAYPWFEYLGLLTVPGVVNLKVVSADGAVVGYVAGDARATEGVGWIVTIAVDAAHRRRGLGRQLLAACERAMAMPVVRLTVRASNEGAIALYARCGYRRRSIWPGYYKDGEDGLVMEKMMATEGEVVGRPRRAGR